MMNRRLFSPENIATEAKRPITYDLCRGSAGSVGTVGGSTYVSRVDHDRSPLLQKVSFSVNEKYRGIFISYPDLKFYFKPLSF